MPTTKKPKNTAQPDTTTTTTTRTGSRRSATNGEDECQPFRKNLTPAVTKKSANVQVTSSSNSKKRSSSSPDDDDDENTPRLSAIRTTNASAPRDTGVFFPITPGDRRGMPVKNRPTYEEQQVESGAFQNSQIQKEMFSSVVRNTLFPLVKFITHPGMLDYGDRVSKIVLQGLNLESELEKKDYWRTCSVLVNEVLNQKRGNVNNEMKKGFLSK
jgi:hypothetical protein